MPRNSKDKKVFSKSKHSKREEIKSRIEAANSVADIKAVLKEMLNLLR